MAAPKRKLVPKKTRFHTRKPEFLSSNFIEYFIRLEEGRGYYIHKWGGGPKHEELKGHWRSYELAKKHLITFLMRTDKMGLARWPGKQNIRHTNYTRMYIDE